MIKNKKRFKSFDNLEKILGRFYGLNVGSLERWIDFFIFRGCYDRKNWFPPEGPKPDDSTAYCDDINYCNKNLKHPDPGIE